MKPTTYAAALVVAATTLYTPKAEALMVWAESYPAVECYRIQEGDTLHGIAKKLMRGAPAGIESVMEASVESRLASWNNITAPEDLTIGNILVVPAQNTDVVQAQDTFRPAYFKFPFINNCPLNYGAGKSIVHTFSVHEKE